MARPTHVTTYLEEIGFDVRIRTHITAGEHGTVAFALTLEVEGAPGQWQAAVRYDNAGGVVHRDRFDLEGLRVEHRRTLFDTPDLDTAIAWARQDLLERLDSYVSVFRTSGT